MNLVASLALSSVLAGLLWMSWRDSRDYAAFKLFDESADRIRFYRKWTLVPMALFGVGGVVLLLALGRIDALWNLPTELAAVIELIKPRSPSESPNLESMLGIAVGMTFGLTISAIVWRKRLKKMRQPMIGDIDALLPRNRKEVAWCIPLALNAGISEEIFYRIALPLLAMEATGSIAASLLISISAFGMAHWYQGWKGAMATTAVGVFMFWLYLSSGSILKPIAVHILIDMIGLVIRPIISQHMTSRTIKHRTKARDASVTVADGTELRR
ncbi:CPBP family intramembrane glutamic endopeptidase [Erythrobacter sp. T5W1-R]|uniref:CPBP family intramembrane glutamic endopeptidase n=1 Tax=Erythrobacter sp. T5W1-R TaxID=3101752 RepID=UPI002AFF3A34|nr:CPBP family intramembrane glutamic endopeptidase [Erythrobacter sp. T5W1-R]MEA1618604.1 CPBP family intramembrane glutamic endopeptidase [Erythrobacter sp. T5W1-R]